MKGIQELIINEVKLEMVVASKDLFPTFSTCQLASDISIFGDVSSVEFEFATKNVSSIIWLRGK